MVVDKIIVVAVSVLIALAIAAGGSMVIAACDDQTGGYPTPMVNDDGYPRIELTPRDVR